MLSTEALFDLHERLLAEFPEHASEMLTRTNRTGDLEQLLDLMGMSYLLECEDEFETLRNGKIVIIGHSKLKEEEILGIAKDLGLDKDRFELCLDYDATQKYDFRKMHYAAQYRVVLFGPVPHSGKGKGTESSIIAGIEQQRGYPRVERLISGNELKITKSNIRMKLMELIAEGYI